jgi:hypothetical protein
LVQLLREAAGRRMPWTRYVTRGAWVFMAGCMIWNRTWRGVLMRVAAAAAFIVLAFCVELLYLVLLILSGSWGSRSTAKSNSPIDVPRTTLLASPVGVEAKRRAAS